MPYDVTKHVEFNWSVCTSGSPRNRSSQVSAMPYDVFFSYRRHDLKRAQPLLDALDEAGIRVWRDERDIPDQASITEEIRQGIADSSAFLAFYSSTYPVSNLCQQEITTAWLAAAVYQTYQTTLMNLRQLWRM